MSLPLYNTITVHEYQNNSLAETQMWVSAEYPITLLINGNPYMTFACSGTDLEAYAAGHLTCEGIIQSSDQICDIEVDEANLSVKVNLVNSKDILLKLEFIKTISAAGGRSRKILPGEELIRKELPVLRPDVILKCMGKFLDDSREHKTTHGVHSAAMYTTEGKELVFFDEIGRHNAIDKTIGHAVLNNISLEDKMILSTGRLSSEIALKMINARVPVLITRASPTSYSVKLLKQYNILAISRADSESFFVINGVDRIIN